LPDYPIFQDSDIVNRKIATMQSQESRRPEILPHAESELNKALLWKCSVLQGILNRQASMIGVARQGLSRLRMAEKLGKGIKSMIIS
jgi:hypothetical protein